MNALINRVITGRSIKERRWRCDCRHIRNAHDPWSPFNALQKRIYAATALVYYSHKHLYVIVRCAERIVFTLNMPGPLHFRPSGCHILNGQSASPLF